MAQQFLADAQKLAADAALALNAETNGPQTNFLPIPYQNAKVKVWGLAFISVVGAAATAVIVRVRRNINGENQLVAGFTVTATPAASMVVPFASTDVIPDNRSVQYTLTVQQVGAGGNGTFAANSYIEAVVLSG